MDVGQIGSTGGRVIAAIGHASARTGVDFAYLLAQAKIESGLNPQASAPTSSARGLFQFTGATWLATLRKHGADHGLGWAAEGGAAAMALRDDPQASALMAGELASDNAAALGQGLGRAPGAADLYLAHFLGVAGALRFLRARDTAPCTAAAEVVPAAAASNRPVFFAADGSARSLAEVYDRFAARFESRPGGNPVPAGGKHLPVAPAPDAVRAARFAYLLLADLGA